MFCKHTKTNGPGLDKTWLTTGFNFTNDFVYDGVQAILSVLNASVAAESGGACVLDPVTSALLPINTQSAGANKSPNITDDAGEGAKR